MLEIITKTSITMLSTNAGIVILVGMAAKFVTREIPIATIAVINNGKFWPAKNVIITVIGVKIQP